MSDSFGRAFLRQSDAIWIISAGVVANELAHGAFVALPFDTSETKGPVGLTMRTDMAPSAAFSLLLQAIREAAQSQGLPCGRQNSTTRHRKPGGRKR